MTNEARLNPREIAVRNAAANDDALRAEVLADAAKHESLLITVELVSGPQAVHTQTGELWSFTHHVLQNDAERFVTPILEGVRGAIQTARLFGVNSVLLRGVERK